MTRVVVFGTFDPLHDGHRFFLEQAARLGDSLIVVAARDSYITSQKQRTPRVPAVERQAALEAVPQVDTFVWGDEWPAADSQRLLRELDFEVVALGYDQEPSDEVACEWLKAAGKPDVQVVRLRPHEKYILKSSLL